MNTKLLTRCLLLLSLWIFFSSQAILSWIIYWTKLDSITSTFCICLRSTFTCSQNCLKGIRNPNDLPMRNFIKYDIYFVLPINLHVKGRTIYMYISQEKNSRQLKIETLILGWHGTVALAQSCVAPAYNFSFSLTYLNTSMTSNTEKDPKNQLDFL